MWGDEAAKEKIFLNGAEFHIRRNLWDAFYYLRTLDNQILLWVDAICIDQQNIPERNKQLAMMKWIYFRADTVVIWLGKKYLKYEQHAQTQNGRSLITQIMDQEELHVSETVLQTTADSGEHTELLDQQIAKQCVANASNEEREMFEELCADGYWDRLWIMQEIGRARQKEVCFGNSRMDWNAFITSATLHKSRCEGPLRLNRLLQEKYSGSHNFRKLLYDHREALCEQPRDKIYGLVGLAADAVGFPMDYGKSLIEVWKDTMEFMNGRGLLRQSEIIEFGGLVKSLLIGNDLGPLDQALQPYELRPNSTIPIEDAGSPRTFRLQAYVTGCVMAIGPPPVEIISSLRKTDQWAAKTQENFREELGKAHQENDTLMRAIVESDETRLVSACFNHVSNVRWRVDWSYSSLGRSYKRTFQDTKNSVAPRSSSEVSPKDNLYTARNSQLFLVKNYFRGKTPRKMGIASGLAEPGDLVCSIPGVGRALIVRVSSGSEWIQENCMQVFGTALFTGEFSRLNESQYDTNLSWHRNDERLYVNIDATTIFLLLA